MGWQLANRWVPPARTALCDEWKRASHRTKEHSVGSTNAQPSGAPLRNITAASSHPIASDRPIVPAVCRSLAAARCTGVLAFGWTEREGGHNFAGDRVSGSNGWWSWKLSRSHGVIFARVIRCKVGGIPVRGGVDWLDRAAIPVWRVHPSRASLTENCRINVRLLVRQFVRRVLRLRRG